MTLHIPEKILHRLQHLLHQELSVEQAICFGSRTRGDHSEYSDIDIALIGEKIPRYIKGRLVDAGGLFTLDVVLFNELDNEEMKENIRKDGIVFYQK